MPTLVLYAIGADLTRFSLDPATGALTQIDAVPLGGLGQYGVFHPNGKHLYLATGRAGEPNAIRAFAIDAASGALAPAGDPMPILARALHIEIDPAGTHLFVSLLDPGTVLVYRLNADGTIGAEVDHAPRPEPGIFVHQARVTPDGGTLLVCTRGNDAAPGRAEDRGGIAIYRIADGHLTLHGKLEMPPGAGPRHLDFSRDGTRAYVAMERGNTLRVFSLADGRPGAEPLADVTTLADPGAAPPGQRAGAIHLHPSERFVYVSNRGEVSAAPDGSVRAWAGENGIAAFRLDGAVPVPIQHAPVHGLEPRSFAIDPAGRWLVAANQFAAPDAPRALDLFAIGEDGRLTEAPACAFSGTGVMWVGFAPQQSGGERG